ncbi:glycoside hydrolase family 17 protein [Glonium stellatum]|uniref:Probable beta-glucosidase btgE n=1 Tax=Glonium stellatum TaxID=574774 RepID=A0A8E2JNH0_9PEZI|nr:glycoside hydrolase family 17 protein [Glonium stellatum]
MKATFFAASAALLGSVAASHQNHAGFHNRRGLMGTGVIYEEVCSTYTSTWCGEATLVPAPPPAVANSTYYVTPSPLPTSTSTCAVPTPEVTTCPTPGTYTFPAKTITVTESTTVCAATTTVLPPGTHTYGGVTTSVVTSTTVTCPYATVSTSGSVTTSVILTTTYVCPEAGEYTIGGTTTSVSETETCVYPIPTTYAPGTYTHSETTVTVVKTSEVYICPYETSQAPSPYVAPTSAVYTPAVYTPVYSKPAYSAPAYSAPAYSAPAAPVYSAPAASVYSAPAAPVYSAPAYSKPAHSAAVYSAAAAKPSTVSYGGNGRIVTKGNKWAMTYTPYTSSGSCKTAGEVMSDIQSISEKGFTTVRVYSTDCSGLENIGAACEAYNMHMIVGVFIDNTGISGAKPQVEAIISWGKWELVSMFVIGNEALFNGYCSASELAEFICSSRTAFQAAGCPKDIPVTTTEPLSSLQEYGSQLCYALDVMGANIQSYFNSGVSPSGAGDFVLSQLELVAKVCPEAAKKGCYNLESGWPTAGNSNGAAVPGQSEQKEAIFSILEKCGTQSAIFSYQNDLWKAAGSYGVEQSWGCADLF